jgi:ATP-dependent Zn protease
VLIKKIIKPIKKKRVLTRKDFDDIQSVDEVNANKKLESQIKDEKNKDTSKSITIILYGISFALLVGLFLYFYDKKKVNTQMLHS